MSVSIAVKCKYSSKASQVRSAIGVMDIKCICAVKQCLIRRH